MGAQVLRVVKQVEERVLLKPRARLEAAVEFIRSAKSSLLLSVFRCDELRVLHELAEAAARGVRVEALLTGRAKGWGKRLGPLAGVLERVGVVVRRYQGGEAKYHAKFMIADHSRALVATHNLTRKCFRRTRDFLLLTSDEGVVSGLVSVFQADSRGVAAPPRPPSDRIVLGPDCSRAAVEALLGEARSSIRILDHKLSDAGIHAILRDRRRRGVGVEIETGRGAGGLRPHGRLILIDGALAVLGSFALSAASLDSRREVAVIVRRPELVAKLERHFDKMAAHPLKQMDAAA